MFKTCILFPVLLVTIVCPGMALQPEGATALDALTRQQHYESMRVSSSSEDLNDNGDCWTIHPGETITLADLEGPGVITEFWHTVGAIDPFYGRTLVLRIYYDGNEKPSVQTPLGDFVGLGHGSAHKDFSSIPVVVTGLGRSRTCFWRMPFRKSIRITVTNDSPTIEMDSFYFHINWQKHEALPEDTVYFHAQYHQEFPAKPGNYVVLDTKGQGHYVGTVYSAHQVELGWFGEGDDFFYIDGEDTPRLKGTGTEEYFLDAWGFREYVSPYAGAPLYEGVFPGDRVSVYRWHIQDPITFKKSLHFEFEHKGSVFNEKAGLTDMQLGSFIERPDWLSSVAFWYQYPVATIDEAMPPLEKRIAPYRTIDPCTLVSRAEPPFLLVPSETDLLYMPNTPDASIEFDLEIEKAGRYQISGVFFFTLMSGIYQPYMDGNKIGNPIDFANSGYTPAFLSLDLHDLEAGTHTLRFEGVDAVSPLSRLMAPKYYGFSVIRFFLLRLEDMEGYHQVLNRMLKEE